MVDAVARHVHQRVRDLLDHLAIELGVLAGDDEIHRLAGAAAQVAHDPRHLLERLPDRHHAQRHRVALQLGGEPPQLRHVARQAAVDERRQGRVLLNQRLDDDQLADHVHQVVELPGIDLDRGGRRRQHRDVVAPPRRHRRVVVAARGRGQRSGRGRDAAAAAVGQGLELRGNQILDLLDEGDGLGPVRCARTSGQAVADVVDHHRQHVHRPEHEVHFGSADADLARTREVEQVLDLVRHAFDRDDAERRRVALDGVERAEDVVEQSGVLRTFVELEQRRLDGAEVIQRFGDEQVAELGVGLHDRQLDGIVDGQVLDGQRRGRRLGAGGPSPRRATAPRPPPGRTWPEPSSSMRPGRGLCLAAVVPRRRCRPGFAVDTARRAGRRVLPDAFRWVTMSLARQVVRQKPP